MMLSWRDFSTDYSTTSSFRLLFKIGNLEVLKLMKEGDDDKNNNILLPTASSIFITIIIVL